MSSSGLRTYGSSMWLTATDYITNERGKYALCIGDAQWLLKRVWAPTFDLTVFAGGALYGYAQANT